MKAFLKLCYFIAAFLLFSANARAQEYTPEWALYDVAGFRFSDGLAPVSENGKWGFIDTNGDIVIPCAYRIPPSFHRGAAVVMDADKQNGIINRYGKYILNPGDYEISYREEVPGFYLVKDRATKLSAIFSGNGFITEFKYSSILLLPEYFPFASLKAPDQRNDVINLLTMEVFEDCRFTDYGIDGFVVYDDRGYWQGYTSEGNPANKSDLVTSPKGNEVYKDERTGRYGIRNAASGKVIVSPKYRLSPKADKNRIWYNGAVELADSLSPTQKYVQVIINEDGKIICGPDTTATLLRYPHYIASIKDFSDYSTYKYFDYSGNDIRQLNGSLWIPVYGNLFYNAPKHIYYTPSDMLYNADSKKVEKDIKIHRFNKDMLIYRKNGKFYYRNIETDRSFGPFDDANQFSEGIGTVKRDGKEFMVDKSGKEYHIPHDMKFIDSEFHEGVIPVSTETPYARGYIYNPLGHAGFAYNNPNAEKLNIRDSKIKFNEAQALFYDGKYAQAIDLYHQALTLRPDYNEAFNNYAACLYNLHHYDEALAACEVVLDRWPDDEYALNLYNKTSDALRQRQTAEEESLQTSHNNSIWDVIGNFANSMASMTGGYSSEDMYQFSYDSPNSQYSSGSTGNYQGQYDHWARRAESCYNSLTNLGFSTTRNGNKRGNTGKGKVSPGNYVAQKRSLREAQSQMKSIRRKASQNGIAISQSPWETASVSY